MARLESQAKLGYYPTPINVVNHIKTALTLSIGARLLDPACGTGEALQILAEEAEVETFGIELEKSRYLAASEKLKHTLWADAITETRISSRMADVLFLNPPYDTSFGAGRMEKEFIKAYLPILALKGVLIFIIPIGVLDKVKGYLSHYFDELKIYRFPIDDYERFKQIVVIGRRERLREDQIKHNLAYLAQMIKESFYYWYVKEKMQGTEKMADNPLIVRSKSKKNYIFLADHVDPEEVAPQTGVLKQDFLKGVAMPDFESVTPLLPLKRGHLAMLLAAGYINGELKQEGYDLVVKGSVVRGAEIIEETDATEKIIITRSRPEIKISVLDMASGEIKELR